jgi:hypothetical protein
MNYSKYYRDKGDPRYRVDRGGFRYKYDPIVVPTTQTTTIFYGYVRV